MKKKVYAIVSPENHIYTIHNDKFQVWRDFFSLFPHRLPIVEAVKAYESIGYKLTEFYLVPVQNDEADAE